MQEQPKAIQRIIQSPAASILVAFIAAGLMLYQGGDSLLTALLSAAIAALMLSQIKARMMFRGNYFPFLGIFMLAQATMMPDIIGIILTCVAVISLTALLMCYNQPEATRTFFVIYLAYGIGALFDRSYALIGILLLAVITLVRSFSARGLVACILGFITPFVMVFPLNIINVNDIVAIYNQGFTTGYSIPLVAISGIACLTGISTFLPSYGYPARSRARNMALLGLTAGAIILPFIDFVNADKYSGLLNVCMAYNICHFMSLKKQLSWLYIVMAWTTISVLIFFT